jgi:orotidine-5'-phosphate decarboxylase
MRMLRSRWTEGKMVCVGLDSDYEKLPAVVRQGAIPEDAVLEFNKAIINATCMSVCAFKPNIAFYSRRDANLRRALIKTCEHIRKMAPGVPIILDAKRADIGNTNTGYVVEAFEEIGADAITVNPYLGEEALKPFLEKVDKGVIVLCRTSNPGAGEFQDRRVFIDSIAEIRSLMAGKDLPTKSDGEDVEWEVPGSRGWFIPLYQLVARRVARYWNKNGNCALVVGATAPSELAIVRYLVDDLPILVPGIGAQGGDLGEVLRAGLTKRGDGLIINVSRSVLFAAGDHTYPEAAGVEVGKLNLAIQTYR